MKSCVTSSASGCLSDHLGSAKVRALYLSDALETGDAAEIISVLIDLRRAVGGQKIVDLTPLEMKLSEALDIISQASLTLVAEQRK